MDRRTFTRLLGSGSLMLPLPTASAQAKRIKVAVVTGADGAHLSAYFPALAETAEASPVVLSDPSGESFAAARAALGDKLAATYKSLDEMLATEKPELALVTMEAIHAPAAIDAALEASIDSSGLSRNLEGSESAWRRRAFDLARHSLARSGDVHQRLSDH